MNFRAGVEGIEPPQEVLETPVLPLYDTPISIIAQAVYRTPLKKSRRYELAISTHLSMHQVDYGVAVFATSQ